MASPFLGIAAGLTQGLPQGAIAYQQFRMNQQRMQMEQQQQSIQAISAFKNALLIPDPAARTTALTQLMPGMGMDPTTPQGQQFLKDQSKYMDDTLQSMSQSLDALGMHMDSKQIGMWWQQDPSGFYNYMFQMQQLRAAQAVMAGQDASQATATQPPAAGTTQQPTQTAGDMGTGGAQAGAASGTPAAGAAPAQPSPIAGPLVGSPEVQGQAAGAPDASTYTPTVQPTAQPVATTPKPVASDGTPLEAKTTDGQGNPSTPPFTNKSGNLDPSPAAPSGYAVVPDKGIAFNNISVGGNPVFWNPMNDPHVQAMNQKIQTLSMLPGPYGEKYAAVVKDQRDLYIKGKTDAIQHYIDMQRLGIEAGTLAVRQAQLGISRALAANQIMGPHSDAGRVATDIELGNLDANGIIQNQNTIRAGLNLPLLQQNQPSPGAAGGGEASGGTSTVAAPSGTPSGAPQQPLPPGATLLNQGEDPPAGSSQVTNEALLKSLGVNKGDVVYTTPGGGLAIRRMSAETAPSSEIGVIQMHRQKALEGRNIVDQMIEMYNKDKTNFGAAGEIKSGVQNVWNTVTDIASLVPLAKQFMSSAEPGVVDKGYFDPALPTAEYNEHVLTMILAGTLSNSTGGLGSGITKEGFHDAEEMTHVIGMDVNSNTAGTRLHLLKKTFTEAIDSYDRMINMGGKAPPTSVQPNVQTQTQFPGQPAPAQPQQPAPQQPAPQQPAPAQPTTTPAKQSEGQPPKGMSIYKMSQGGSWQYGPYIPQSAIETLKTAHDPQALSIFEGFFGKGSSAKIMQDLRIK